MIPSAYLSSTFGDLAREREEVRKWLPEYQYHCKHSEEAGVQRPLDRCLEDIDSCELYLLLLGPRYGSLVRAGPQNEELSYTHHEFRHARSKGMPCLAYQIKSYSYDRIEADEVSRREKFWQEVKEYRGGFKPDVSPEDLSKQIAAALTKISVNRNGLVSAGMDLSAVSPATGFAMKPAGPLSLMIQVRNTGESNYGRERYLLIPELYGLDSSALSRPTGEPWEPRDNVFLESAVEKSEDANSEQAGRSRSDPISFVTCVQSWLEASQELALQLPGVPEVMLEVFLPNDLLFYDLCSLNMQSSSSSRSRRSSRTRPMISTCSFMVRSLERAEDQPVSRRYELAQKWKHIQDQTAQMVVELQGPSVVASANQAMFSEWLDRLFDRLSQHRNAVCLYLLDPPADPEARVDVIDVLVDSNIPVVVLWPSGASADEELPKRRQQRSRLACSLLGLPESSILSVEAGAKASVTQDFSPDRIDLSFLSAKRMELYASGDEAIRESVRGAVVVMDVPDRWPCKTVDVRTAPADRIRSPM